VLGTKSQQKKLAERVYMPFLCWFVCTCMRLCIFW